MPDAAKTGHGIARLRYVSAAISHSEGAPEEEKTAKHVIQTKRGAPPGGAYSQGRRAGDFLFVTGTGPIDPVTGELVGDSIEKQTEQTIDNISAILEAAA